MKKFAESFLVLILYLLLSSFSSLVKSQDLDKSISITTTSEDALSFYQEGLYKLENLQSSTAAALFEEAIETDPNFALAYLHRSRAGGGFIVSRENLERAVSLIDKVSEGEKHMILFHEALADGNVKIQKEHIGILLEQFPDDKRVHYFAGLHFDRINDYPSALKHFLKAVELDKNFAAAYNMTGYAHSDMGYYDAAAEAFKSYIKLIPDSPNPYDSYGELLLKIGKYDESIEQYKKAYNKDLLFTNSLMGIGHNYIFKNDFETARKYYRKQFQKAPNINEQYEALLWEAISYVHAGNIEKSLEILTKLRKLVESEFLVPDVIETNNTAGFILTESGNPKKGLEYINLAFPLINYSILPGAVKEKYTLKAHLNRCFSFAFDNNFEAAYKEAEICKELIDERNNPVELKEYKLTLGLLEFKKGDFVKAVEYFDEANTDDPYYWYYIGLAYQKLGYTENANKLFDKIKYWNVNGLGFALIRKRVR